MTGLTLCRKRSSRPTLAMASTFVLLWVSGSAFQLRPALRPQQQPRPFRHRARFLATPVRANSLDTKKSAKSSSAASTDEAAPQKEEQDAPMGSKNRLKHLKDLMWVREALEDVTAAEFACSVEAAGAEDGEEEDTLKRRRDVDYEKLLSQLNRRIRDMGCSIDIGGTKPVEIACVLDPEEGMGRLVYEDKQRNALLERIIRTRHSILEVMREKKLDITEESFTISLPEIRVEIPREDDPTLPGPKLYVRDDGTVDWDGALQDQAALKKFGGAVWARINGRDPESVQGATNGEQEEKPKAVTARVIDTPEIKSARERLDNLKKELAETEAKHTALLSSSIRTGQAVANVNLATLEPAQRIKIRESVGALEKLQEQVSFQTLVYELERIFAYLVGEVGSPALNGYIPLQDRLNVAEFGLLEAQIKGFNQQLEAGESVDQDVLAVVMDQLADFKRRLGIDYYVTGLSFDGEAIRIWLADLLETTKSGLAFYVKGVRLFWNDIVFCASLISRAAQGYTLKPREVRTIRRTFKDVLTFIPFVIILLIPLSPVGHVLVFGAIQRFFPDFFPSCFTEQRQNLLQLYETAEYTEFTIDENWKEKISRVTEALLYAIATSTRSAFRKVSASLRGEEAKDEGKQ